MTLSASQIAFNHANANHVLVGKRFFERLGEGHYEVGWPDMGVTCHVAQIRRGREHDLLADLTVTTNLPGARAVEGVLSAASFNLSSVRSRVERAGFLRDRSGTTDIDWTGLLETVCLLVMRAEQAGEPIKPLAEYPLPAPDEQWVISGIPLMRRHPMILFGDGGTGKSTIALYLGATLAQRGIRVLYADWEFSAEDHRERLQRLCGVTAMPTDTLHYVRCSAPLVNEAPRLQAHIVKAKVEYLVCDSIGFAVPGRPEEAENAIAYYRALRGLGIGSLHLAHTTKSLEHGEEKPFGSAFWANGARSLWFVKRANEDGPEADAIEVALYHKKSNTSRRLPALGLRLAFETASIDVHRCDPADNEELAVKLPTWQRMAAALKRQALTEAALAEECEAKASTVRKVLERSALFLRLPDGRIGLAAEGPPLPDDGSF